MSGARIQCFSIHCILTLTNPMLLASDPVHDRRTPNRPWGVKNNAHRIDFEACNWRFSYRCNCEVRHAVCFGMKG
jgi:hypothetical protein